MKLLSGVETSAYYRLWGSLQLALASRGLENVEAKAQLGVQLGLLGAQEVHRPIINKLRILRRRGEVPVPHIAPIHQPDLRVCRPLKQSNAKRYGPSL